MNVSHWGQNQMLWKNPKANNAMKNDPQVPEPYHVWCITVNQQWNSVNENQTEKSLSGSETPSLKQYKNELSSP